MGGKETKIGLAVILILLVIFGVVLTRRLMGTPEDPQASFAVPKDQGASKSDNTSAAKDPPATLILGPAKPTVLAANASSSKTPKPVSPDSGAWTTVADDKKTATASDAAAKAATPTYMPDPPKPSNDRYSSYASPPQLAAAPAPPHGRTSAYAAVASDSPSDPFNRSKAPAAPYPDNTAAADTGLQLVAPPSSANTSSSRTVGSNFRRPFSRSSATQQAPEYSQSQPSTYALPDEPIRPRATSQSRFGSTDSLPSRGMENYRNEGGKYEVQPNENYWKISEKLYGTGAYFKALAEHNRKKIREPERLSVGEEISAPSIAQLEKSYPDLCPKPTRRESVRSRFATVSTRSQLTGGRNYVVQEGDTLFDIARNELGKASRWSEIYDLNRDALGKDYNYLTPGMQLVLPDNGPTDAVTHRPGTTFQR